MRIAFLIIIVLHGLIHVLGFLKAFGFHEGNALTLPISKPMGLLWLLATILFLTYGILHIVETEDAWLIGLIAVAISQFLMFSFWKDAKFGTLPNIIILCAALIAYGHANFQKLVQHETSRILNQNTGSTARVMSEHDLTALPQPVKTWLQHSGAVGKPCISIGKVMQQAEMKMKPEQEGWLSATAVQYSTFDVPAFIWTVNLKMNRLMHFQGRDKFEYGKGEMLIKLNASINVVHERGEKLDESTLQRYLGEMVWFPSLALSPYITWQEVNDTTATATMDYHGTRGSGTFYFNPEGDFIQFSAWRYQGNEADARRYEWVLLVDGYKSFEGIKVPSKMTATWKLEDRDWTWLKLEILDIRYNENASH